MHCLIFPNLFYFFSFVVFVEKCSGTVRIIHRFHKNHQTTKKEKPICGMKFQNKRGNVKNGIFKFIFSLSLFAPVVDNPVTATLYWLCVRLSFMHGANPFSSGCCWWVRCSIICSADWFLLTPRAARQKFRLSCPWYSTLACWFCLNIPDFS